MKRIITTLIALMLMTTAMAQKTICVSTEKTDLVMQVAPNGRLYQTYLGTPLTD